MTDEEQKEQLAQAIRDLVDEILPVTYQGQAEDQIQEIVKAISNLIDKKIAHEIFSLVNND